ncbi:MAG: hypothetical protein U0797_05470 [Gemmataceae bacterium]
MAKKTSCPITREQFRRAKPVTIQINDQKLIADPKAFSTGSLGWYLNAKVTVEVDGVPVQAQVGLNLTIVGSKELPKEEGQPEGDEPTSEPAAAAG